MIRTLRNNRKETSCLLTCWFFVSAEKNVRMVRVNLCLHAYQHASIILCVDSFSYFFSGNTALHLAVMLGRKGNFSVFESVIIFVQFLLALYIVFQKTLHFKILIVSEERHFY